MISNLGFTRGFLRNVGALASGTALAQVINLAFTPLITRIYGPEAYGGLGFFLALLSFLVPLAGMCYPLAIVLPKREAEARTLTEISTALTALTAVVLAVILIADSKLKFFSVPFSFAYVLLPLGLVGSMLIGVFTQHGIRDGRFRLLSIAVATGAVLGGLLKLILGIFSPSADTLVSATVLVLLVQCGILGWLIEFKMKARSILRLRRRHWMLARKYIRFPLYRLPHASVVALNQLLPIFMLGTLFGMRAAGFFALTKSVLTIPINLIGKAIHDVSYPTISRRKDAGLENYRFVGKLTLALGGVSLVPMLIFTTHGGQLFEFVFGEEWRVSGIYAAWMSLWFAFNLSNKPAAASISVYGLDSFVLKNGFVNLILSAAGFSIGYYVYASDVAAVALFSLFGIACQLSLIAKVLITVRHTDKKEVVAE